MSTVFLAVTTLAVIAVTIAFIVLVRGCLREMHEISGALDTTAKEIAETAREARNTLGNVDRAVSTAGDTLARVDRVAEGADRLLDGDYVAEAVAKALKTSSSGVTSVYQGIKQGIRTLFGNTETRKGGTSDE